MAIDNFFIRCKTPAQYIYWGENYVDIFRRSDPGKTFKRTRTFDDISLAKVTADDLRDMAGELLKVDTGIILNSGPFIFNFFEFEKFPFWQNQGRELVEWRLKKVFPENLEEYEHDFFRLNKKRILSILLKKGLKEKIETLTRETGISLTYLGNSTVEIMNHMAGLAGLKKNAPDFFVEIDKNLSITVFLDQSLPYYLRKFRSDQAPDIINEVVKTINFVKSSYAKVPRTCSLLVRGSDADLNLVSDELAKMDILPLDLKNKEQFIFPAKG